MTSFRIFLLAGLGSVGIVTTAYFWIYGSEKESWIISGGESGGNYDAVAQVIAKSLEKTKGWKVKTLESSGSGGNLRKLREGKVDLCLVQHDFPGDANVRTLATLYEEALHLVIRDGNLSLTDLADKKISLGSSGGGTEALAKATLNHLGIFEGENTWMNEGLKEGLANLRSGKTDVVCVVTGIGNPLLGKALAEGDLKLLPLGEEPAAGLAFSYPFVEEVTIPAAAYSVGPGKGVPAKSLPSVGVKVILACSKTLPENDALELVTTLFDNQASLAKAEALMARMAEPKEDLALQFPTHEGARQHYQRDAPTFLQNWSEPMAFVISILAIAWGLGVTLREFIAQRHKDRLDDYFKQVDALTTELVEGANKKRCLEISQELHAIRRETIDKLVTEKLDSDDFFVIFQRQLHTAQQLVSEQTRQQPSRRRTTRKAKS